MKKSLYRWGTLSAILTACLLAGCAKSEPEEPVPPPLLDKKMAAAKVIAAVGDTTSKPLVIRAAQDYLKPGTPVGEALGDAARTTRSEEWFFVADLNPLALPGHAITYYFVDRKTGDIAELAASSYPLINDDELWESIEGIDDPRDLVYSNLNYFREKDGKIILPGDGEGTPTPPDEFISDPPSETEHECCPEPRRRIALLLYNFDSGPLRNDISNNITGMAGALRANGYTVPNFPPSTGRGNPAPAIYLGDKRGRGLQQIRDFVSDHDDEEDCCEEIIVYYSGHGNERTENGKKRYYFGLRTNYRGENGNNPARKRMYAEDLAAILGKLKSCHIHVVLDCCHSGGFIDALFTLPGVRTVRVSCTADEVAWGGDVDSVRRQGRVTQDPYGRANGESGSEFTSGFVKGLNDHIATNPGVTPARPLVDIGFVRSGQLDVTALAGATHPTGQTRISGSCDCCDEEHNTL